MIETNSADRQYNIEMENGRERNWLINLII